MSDLETFRSETRAWLEANCPPSMRGGAELSVTDGDDDSIWGGAKATFKNPEQKLWLGPHGGEGLDRADLAEGTMAAAGSRMPKPACCNRNSAA